MNNIDTFVQLVQESDNIVFFGGAGVSTESGIPDFRSPDGLYNQQYKYPPETIISHSFYQNQAWHNHHKSLPCHSCIFHQNI